MNMQEMLRAGTDTLQQSGISDYRTDAWYLLSYCMDNITRAEYYMKMPDEVNDELVSRYMRLVDMRAAHRPLQYIIGIQEFMGISYEVNESVLIPRQDTEVLVSLAIEHSEGKRVIDMCTGSGCIAISIALLGAPESVCAVDVSDEALDIAKLNAECNKAEVTFISSNLWNNVSGEYDIIVSNPPYITDSEMDELMPEVRLHEPELALRGGSDGLEYYRRITEGSERFLAPGGLIMYEIGCEQAEAVSMILEEYGLKDIRVIKDLAGLDRVVWGRR